ncbi:hypothetical protein [Acidiferrobacter sp.]
MAALVAYARMPWPAPRHTVVVDTRRQALCVRRSVVGGLCLSPGVFQDRSGGLVSFRNLRWLLGTMGLTGSETAVVAGDHGTAEDFVAGLLYLAGQRRVEVVQEPLTGWLGRHPRAVGTGRTRGVFREAIYTAWPRTHLVVLRRELAASLHHGPPVDLVDGRLTDRKRRPRADQRIPGAQSWPLALLGAGGGVGSLRVARGGVIAYGEGPYQSVAYFARLRMLGVRARVFLGGWRDWSAHAHAARVRRRGDFAVLPTLAGVLVAAAFSVIILMWVWRRARRR